MLKGLHKPKNKRKFLLLLLGLVAFNLFVFGTLNLGNKDSTVNKALGILPTPTPFLFEEFTIPYLRSRSYESSLGEMTQVSSNQNYTSFLTSFVSDGLKINGLLTIPKGEKPTNGWPAIVFIHGYIPPRSYETQGNYTAYVDFLARNGFVVFKIDLRGHADSEGEASGAYYSSDYIIDVLNARAALQGLDSVNPSKVGLWGHSMAGNVVMRSMASSPSIPAIAIWAGAVYSYEDFQKYGIGDNSYRPPSQQTQTRRRRDELFKTYGQFDPNNDFWKQVPATNYLSDIKGAILINHAVDDNVVNIGYSRDLNNILNRTNINHEFYEYPSGGHNISGESFNQAMQKTVEFFKKYLGKV